MKNIAAGCAIAIPVSILASFAMLAWWVSSWSPATWDFLGWAAQMTVYGLMVVAGALGLMVISWGNARRSRRERTYRDGVLPLWHRKRHVWRADLPRILAIYSFIQGEDFVIDPNRVASPAFSFDAFGSFRQIEPAQGWAMQHAYNLAVEHNNGVRAAFTGDDAKPWSNLLNQDTPPRLTQATLRPKIPANIPEPEVPQLPAPVEPALSPEQALARSNDGMVYIGQAKDGGRNLAAWNAHSASTLGVFGANGTGKTSTVATMATLAMVRWGWRLWILDGKDAGDWDEFGNHATVVPIGGHNIGDTIEAIWQEYEQRAAVMTEHRARRYWDLPADVQAEFPQWGMVFEEFGATRLGLNPKAKEHLDRRLGVICQKARYTGWHGVFIDQRPSGYTDEMKGNLKSIACFQLMMNQGQAVNAYQAGNLAPRGEFEMDGGRYWAFHAEPLARPVLANTPVRVTNTERSQPFIDMPETIAPWHVAQETNTDVREHTPVNQPDPMVAVYERTRSWDSVAEAFWKRDPNQTQADLCRLMAIIKNDGRSPRAFTGEANRLYHTYHPKGDNYAA